MDLFVYGNRDTFTNGKPITGYRTATWVERFQTPGEFKIEAPLSSGLYELLPLGSVIGHVETLELMTVENVEIDEEADDEPQLTISGRSFISIMDHRHVGLFGTIVTDWVAIETSGANIEMNSVDLYARLVFLMQNALTSSFDAGIPIPNLEIIETIPYVPGGTIFTFYPTDNLLKAIIDQIVTWGIGIKTNRRNNFPGTITSTSGGKTDIELYQSTDRTATVKFSPQTGDVESAKYLYTNKNKKTSVLLKGRWVTLMYNGAETGFDRHVLVVSAQDIDEEYDYHLLRNTPDFDEVVERMKKRAVDILARTKEIRMVTATISENSRYRYRVDYKMGDIITLDTNYGDSVIMRVVEFAEVEDENGTSSYPTLSTYTVS